MGEQVASTIIYVFLAVATTLTVADILYRRREYTCPEGPPMRKPRNGVLRWNVYFSHRRPARLGTIDARDRRKTLKKAIKRFEIPMPDRRHISIRVIERPRSL